MPNENFPAQRIFTVSELTVELNNFLEDQYSILWINGEISNYKLSVSGHCYFTLKDKEAQLQCVIFRGPFNNLKFSLKDGLQVTALGRLSIYPPRGNYQLIAEYIEPKGRGALQAAFEELKAKLEHEGLFDDQHKSRLPILPKKISVITSPTGAVRHDIETVILRRFPNTHIELVPVSVQGHEAPAEIVAALSRVNHQHTSDVIILARGGGSLEDLQAFNSEEVARAIYGTTIPIVSAVGHETDYTISDFAADLRAPTPSAAAEMVVPLKIDLERHIAGLQLLLSNAMETRLTNLRQNLDTLLRRLRDPQKEIVANRLRTDELLQRLTRNMTETVVRQWEQIQKFMDSLLRNPLKGGLNLFQVKVENNRLNLLKNLELKHKLNTQQWHNVHLRLENANPISILNRGYSITRLKPTNQVLSDASSVNTGDGLEIILHKGRLEGVVTQTYSKNQEIAQKKNKEFADAQTTL